MTPAEAMAMALATTAERREPDVQDRDFAAAILAALPEEFRADGHKGHWRLTLWWDPEPAPPLIIEEPEP
jgi:hypothetical protein